MLQNEISQIAERLRGLRQMTDTTPEEMAQVTDTAVEEYLRLEEGEGDFSFTFLYNCAKHLGVDLTELITGEMPKLSFFTVVRRGEGMPIRRRAGFEYQHLAYLLRGRMCEPFLVKAPYRKEEQNQEIALSRHKGQEFDFVLKGSLKVRIEDHYTVLHAGDSIYYDSSHGHGMIAAEGEDCEFLAMVVEGRDER
ncbi:helix-turn-helix domain-containing protein [Bittarella massiliensis (ex Durand et al. 2017)]|uniref:helix-turn-helix domain-containing protein n=1 Tax=Bittarella massiliensis (ex Durand et al. 2017) TaxID=1720313 RepID=UPI001AA1BDC3|nr:cupin domain-containing protein [Bittarella massiliensis (ex Durand et al. 2017)]